MPYRFLNSFDFQLRNIAPREGTETVEMSVTGQVHVIIKKYSSPRGDGNAIAAHPFLRLTGRLRNIAPREGTETQCQNHDPEQQQD